MARQVAARTRQLSLIAVFTALIAVATSLFTVNVPATKGYFNVGEAAIYACALLCGGFVGGLSAGIGSMIADLALGYTLFAPATLVIKGFEGAVVGYLGGRRACPSRRLSMVMVGATAAALATIILAAGAGYYTGSMEFSLTLPQNQAGFRFDVPLAFWVGLAILAALSAMYVPLKRDPSLSWEIAAVLAGGAVMVTGYFLYEQLILGVAALVEVPINVGQVMIGAVLALPVVRAIRIPKPQGYRG
ncbi:ECF transporter S component [Candidatus Bathyarchaeota archaeon]|nr:ECF transporter S component [Candidatus Bathyarchaeota archaeon]